MLLRTIALSALIVTGVSANAAPLRINPDASGQKASDFLDKIDSSMPRVIRGLSHQNAKEFNAMQFAVMLNESANIERKLDLLIAEIQKTNRLLAQKK